MSLAERDAPRPPSLLRSVVPIVLFVLVCGIVGPIFLVLGLSAGDAEGAGWLLPVGILITVVDLAIGLAIGVARHRSRQKDYRLRLRGRPASATVLSFEQTNVEINDQPLVRLSLRIHGADIVPFEVETKAVVPGIRLPLLYAGELPALVDPESGEWEIDWASAPAVPAMPGAAAVMAPRETRPVADRLAELDELLRRDLVSREEYDAKRAAILDEV